MNEPDLTAKGYVKGPDGQWSKPRPKGRTLCQIFASEAYKPSQRPKKAKPEGMNQTERRYHELLKDRYPNGDIRVQSITLLLAPRCRFTPDFAVFFPAEKAIMVDVKGGHTWEDSIIKNKWAAVAYPMFRFIMAKWDGKQWKEKEIPNMP